MKGGEYMMMSKIVALFIVLCVVVKSCNKYTDRNRRNKWW
jgi:hypothetical protein